MTDTLLSRTEHGVLTLTMNRPEALNAFVPEMLAALAEAVEAASRDDAVSVLVLRGAGKAFSAGVDLKVLREMDLSGGQVSEEYDRHGIAVASAIRGCPKPVIARVHGACFTGALELALMADFILTTEDTKFGDTHAKFGLRPSWGMSQTLPQAVGLRRARELSFTARTFTGAEAAAWGLANEAAADEAALDALVEDRCRRIVANSQAAVAASKDLFALAAENRPLAEALKEEVARDYDIRDTEERLSVFGR